MGTAIRSYRAARGKLPTDSRINVVDAATEAVFPIGLTSRQGRLAWRPWDTDHPHCLIAGTTGSGKSRLMETFALQPLIGGWGWDVEIIDGKGAADHWAAASNGAVLCSTPDEILDSLQRAVDDIRRRSDLMNRVEIVRPRLDGVLVIDKALTFRQLPDDVRAREGMRPRLIVIDELASVIGMKSEGAKAVRANKAKGIQGRPAGEGVSGAALVFTIVQLARSAGIHLLLGIQRPDAKLIDGFVRHNIPSRILFGPANADAEEMVLESAIKDHPERYLPRPVGTGFAVAIGGRQIARFHADLLDRDRYLPLAGPDSLEQESSRAEDSQESPTLHVTESADAVVGDVPEHSSGGPHASTPSDTPPVGGRTGSRDDGPPSAFSRFVTAARPIATGPFVRMSLRVCALRNLARPVVPGPFVRDPFLAVACKEEAGHRCSACGAKAPVEADHRVPLSFGGLDVGSNLQSLCIRPRVGGCHGAKTRMENRVRRLRTQGARGIALPGAYGLLGVLRLMPLWVKVGFTIFSAGLILGSRFGWYVTVLLLVILAGPLALRAFLLHVPIIRHGVAPRGKGLNKIDDYDSQTERANTSPGFNKAFSNGYYGSRSAMAWGRIRLGALCATFIAGWTAPQTIPLLLSGIWRLGPFG